MWWIAGPWGNTAHFYYMWNKTCHVLWIYLCIMHRFFSYVAEATHQESCLALIYMQPQSHTACYKYLGAVWLVNILCITLKIIASSQEIISLSCFYNKMNDVLAMTLRNSSKKMTLNQINLRASEKRWKKNLAIIKHIYIYIDFTGTNGLYGLQNWDRGILSLPLRWMSPVSTWLFCDFLLLG